MPSFIITSATTDPLKLDAKGRALCVFTVTNHAARALRGVAKVKALGDTKLQWLSIEGEVERDFGSGDTQQFTVTFDGTAALAQQRSAPSPAGPGAPASGEPVPHRYPFRLDVASATNFEEDFTEGPTVTVEVDPVVSAPPRKFPLWIIPVIAVVVIGIAITTWLLLRTKKVEVPNVVGKPVAEATSDLEELNLVATVIGTKVTGKFSAGEVVDQLPSPGGELVAEGSIVDLVVEGVPEEPTPTPTPTGPVVLINFADSAASASWTNNAGHILPFNGSEGDDRGFVINRDNARLEDNTTAVKVIETHPKWEVNGNITGIYVLPSAISSGDTFRTRVGFMSGARAGNVRLRVLFNGGLVDEISKSYDGSLRDWKVDLSSYAGKQGLFSLQVLAIPTSAQAWLCWIDPRIER